MKAELLANRRVALSDDAFAEIRVWLVPSPLEGSIHSYKYSLAYVVRGECVLRYDNERGKGDHRHYGDAEHAYEFTDIGRLIRDFFKDIEEIDQ